MPKNIWILVANSSQAKVYKAENNSTLSVIEYLEHPESRLHDGELVTNQPGRSFDSIGPGRHAMQPKASPQTLEFHVFARHVTEHLENANEKGLFDSLYIFANPSFLGILRQFISPGLDKMIKGEIDKDMTHMNPREIREQLPLVL